MVGRAPGDLQDEPSSSALRSQILSTRELWSPVPTLLTFLWGGGRTPSLPLGSRGRPKQDLILKQKLPLCDSTYIKRIHQGQPLLKAQTSARARIPTGRLFTKATTPGGLAVGTGSLSLDRLAPPPGAHGGPVSRLWEWSLSWLPEWGKSCWASVAH